MADDQKTENIGKKFDRIEFLKVEDKYDVKIDYDSNSELLTLQLTNATSKNVFKHDFDKESVHKITDECKLAPDLVVKMIIDTLSSKDLTSKNARIFLLPNIKQGYVHSTHQLMMHSTHITSIYPATAKYDEIRSLKKCPDPMTIPTGFQPKSNNNTENNQLENCLLFVLHFAAPPYIYFNYVFTLKERDISENEKLGMRFDDLQKENIGLKEKVNTMGDKVETQQSQINELLNSVQTQQQQINQLTQRLQQLETKVDNEAKVQEIDLNLHHNWVQWDGSWPAKAIKIGHVVYLSGLLKNGTNNHIATLPEGWRPSKNGLFGQFSDKATRIDVYTNGQVHKITDWGVHLSLAGISFVVP